LDWFLLNHSKLLDFIKKTYPYILIFFTAFFIRCLYLGELKELPDFDTPAVDAAYHDYWAQGIATGEWPEPGGQIRSENPEIHKHPFFRPPGYPYFLGTVYALFGHDYVLARMVQFLLGSLSCVLLSILGARLAGRKTGLLAGVLAATYWVFIFFEGELQPPVVGTVLLLLAVLAVLTSQKKSGSILWAGVSGVFLGLASLTIPNLLALIPVTAVWLGMLLRKTNRRKAVLSPAVLCVCALLAILPATVRNWRVSGEPVLISTNAGINFYAGNNPRANGYDVNLLEFGTSFDHLRMVRHVESKLGRSLTHTEVSDYFAKQAWSHILENPGHTLELIFKKARLFWGAEEIFSNKELNFARQESEILRLLPLNFPAVFSFAVVGVACLLIRFKKRRKDATADPATESYGGPGLLLAGLMVLTLFITYLPFFVTARYRVPILPFLLLFSAVGIRELLFLFSQRKLYPAAILLLATAGLYGADVLASFDIKPNSVYWHHLLGVTHARKGESQKALDRFDLALRAKPDHVPSLFERGKALSSVERLQEAAQDFQEVIRLQPGFQDGYLELGRMFFRLKRTAEAVEIYRQGLQINPRHIGLQINAGTALQSIGDTRGAIKHFGAAVELDPANVEVSFNLGLLFFQNGEYLKASNALIHSIEIDPKSISARSYLVLALLETHQFDLCVRQLEEGLRQDPDNPFFMTLLATILAAHPDDQVRDGKRALSMAQKAISLGADEHPEAWEALGISLAEVGQFKRSLEAIEEGLKRLNSDDEKVKVRLLEEKERVRSGRPWRLPGPPKI
jgi:tetratricopeptide (TPR) repeat protein